MKLKSAFAFCLLLIAGFIGLATLAELYLQDTEISIFFCCATVVFLVMLPACSMKN